MKLADGGSISRAYAILQQDDLRDSRATVQQDIAEGGTGFSLHPQHDRPAARVVSGSEFSEAVAGAAGEDQFAFCAEFAKGAVGQIGARAVDLNGSRG